MTTTAPPVFVGGTGRSGTTVVARLIGHHSRYAAVTAELKFHANRGGLADLVEGRTDLETFIERLRNRWYLTHLPDGSVRGIRGVCRAPRFEQVVAAFERRFPEEPVAAAATLLRDILDPYARRFGKAGWVEQTPTSAMVGRTLVRILPELRLVHVVRDGRDVAASVAAQRWGPDDPVAAVDYWGWRLRRAHAGTEGLGPGQLLVVSLERLVTDRTAAYEELLGFLQLEDEPSMRSFFDAQMTMAAANTGRWRALPNARAVNRRYRRVRRGLIREGVAAAGLVSR